MRRHAQRTATRPLVLEIDSHDMIQPLSHDERNISLEEINHLESLDTALRKRMQKYEAAIDLMKVRFDILNEDLRFHKKRNPIHHVESRLKSPTSIFEKLHRYGKESTIENVETYILDIAGVRVICSYIQDAYSLLERLQAQDDLEIVRIKDYISSPKPNGYRSLHVVIRIPVYFMDKKEMVPVEIQFRTIAMDFWASLEHDLKYKALHDIRGIDASRELKECSEIIENVEARMQVLAHALDSQMREEGAQGSS